MIITPVHEAYNSKLRPRTPTMGNLIWSMVEHLLADSSHGVRSYTIMAHTIHMLYYTILYYTILYYTILYYAILYCTVLYSTLLYYTILYYIILYFIICVTPQAVKEKRKQLENVTMHMQSKMCPLLLLLLLLL